MATGTTAEGASKIPQVLEAEGELLDGWIREQIAQRPRRATGLKEAELRQQCSDFLHLLRAAAQEGQLADTTGPHWQGLREMLADLSRSRGQQGFTPSETATFVFSFKSPFFARLRQAHGADAEGLARDLLLASEMLDRLGLHTTEIHQQTREDVIKRQQEEMLELSTPVVKLWDGVLALPLIGTLDSNRTAVIMEALLHRLVETGAPIAILDITGVPTVDTLTAQHLLKTVAAARLMGADCIISGIRPQIAQTIVELGVDLGEVTTKASLADAFKVALTRLGRAVTKAAGG